MNNFLVETTSLDYSFSGKDKTLQQLSLQVPAGSIYGFLGPNGAGKTTTLRLLLGLLKKQAGTISVFGKEFSKNRVDILQRTGSLIEQPSLYAHLTGKENIEIYRRIYQCDRSSVEKVLQTVGLQSAAGKKAKAYSLGMKQRLSLAIALLHQPQLLILDEPTNGLDPNGIIEMRELIKKLNREDGTTIIVSSHLLSEIEKLATHAGIINHGKFLFQGSLPELNKLKTSSSFIEIETNDNTAAAALLLEQGSKLNENGSLILPYYDKEQMAVINRKLVQNQLDVYQLFLRQIELEQLFLQLTAA
jgi:lantibiotic transport system ATP-binding protein